MRARRRVIRRSSLDRRRPVVYWLLAALLLVGAIVSALLAIEVGPSARVGRPPFFVIGVFDQPSYSFPKWKSRGINTIINYQSLSGTVPYAQWRAALGHENLYAIRGPQGNPARDARDPRLLAFLQPDEADRIPSERPRADQNYRRWHAAAPTKPIFMNFSGGDVMGAASATYSGLLKDATWVSNDLYPIAGFGAPNWLDLRQPGSNRIGEVLSKLSDWSSGKPQFQVVEASPQGLPGHGAATINGDQLRGTVWDAVFHGVAGIVYFPQALGPSFSFDAAPADVVASMTAVNAELAQLGPVLLQPNLGGAQSVPAPFERIRKRYRGGIYTFTLNFSPVSESLDGASYGPYEMRYAPALARPH
jgi:hypothetical protein